MLSVSAINASELLVKFGAPVDAATAENSANYGIRINDVDVPSTSIQDIKYLADTEKNIFSFDTFRLQCC